MGHELFAVTGEKVDDRDFDHGIGSGLQAHGSAGSADEYLCGQSRVVDAHAELKALVLSAARHSFACHVHSVAHVLDLIDRFYLDHVGLVAREVGVGLHGLCHQAPHTPCGGGCLCPEVWSSTGRP